MSSLNYWFYTALMALWRRPARMGSLLFLYHLHLHGDARHSWPLCGSLHDGSAATSLEVSLQGGVAL